MASKAMNSVDYNALDTNVKNIEDYTANIKNALSTLNTMIEENVNTGAGIYDGRVAAEYKASWQEFATEFDTFVQMCQTQASNIRLEMENIRVVDESGGSVEVN